MKKHILTAITAVMLCGLCACGNKAPETAGEETTETVAEAVSAEEIIEAGSTEEAEAPTETAADGSSAAEPIYAPEGADLTVFHNDGNGAVVFDAPAGDQSEATLIAAAQLLYQSACETSFRFSVGCPYEYDGSTYVTAGAYDWTYVLITQEGINSIADIKADYHRVFSDKYPDHIDETFIEQDGRAYCLNGSRGSDIFYRSSEVISLDSKTDDELFFTVRNYYDGSDWGDEPYYTDKNYSVVISPDGTWRAGIFTLPN